MAFFMFSYARFRHLFMFGLGIFMALGSEFGLEFLGENFMLFFRLAEQKWNPEQP